MPAAQPPCGPSCQALLAEVQALRQRVAALEQEKHDLEVMLEMTTDHADDLSETLQQERDDLEVMLEMTTDHADTLEADLQSQAETLARRSQFIRETFGRYVSEDVVAQLLDVPEGIELGGELRKVTLLMSDLRGFTAFAECLTPQEVMTVLNRYLEAMVDVILAYRGTIIEILGDGLLVLFGAPLSRDDDAERAVACALAMQLRLDATNTPNRQAGLPDVDMGIGIHTGEVVVGNIGSQQRTKYGVVGSAVNLTGRIESYTTGGQILISPTTYTETAAVLTVSHQMTVAPKGVATPITLYAVSGIGGPITCTCRRRRRRWFSCPRRSTCAIPSWRENLPAAPCMAGVWSSSPPRRPNCTSTSQWRPSATSSCTSCVLWARWCQGSCLPK
jgi:class 3 adenylate cyclase